ncbi:MAG: helix-turn-helix domain-containing protein [Pseudonocardiales bacterium]|nr:helix-turn-helix domain-containing protein [Pseudonocardiales bacterium]
MSGNPHTSVRSRQVAAELRTLREQAGLSGAEVAKLLGMSPSKISRLETGITGLQIEDVAALLGLYKVPAATRDELLDQVRRAEERGWWTRQPGLPKLWRTLIDFEAKASRVQNYEALVVPGLLQTPEYARAIIQGIAPTVSESELNSLVAARMARQTLLTRASAPQFFAVVDEGALRRPIGEPGVMHRQLQHLLVVAEQPHVTLRVVPVAAGAQAGLRGSFVILEFAEEPALVYMENHGTEMFLEEEADVAAYRVALGNILQAALAPAATTELIAQIVTELG